MPRTANNTRNHYNRIIEPHPINLDLKRDRGLTVQWSDGTSSFYPVEYLRRMSPSAETRHLREEMARNPLTVLPSSGRGGREAEGVGARLMALDAEFVGNYALRIRFSDGHHTGLYSWRYLREIDPESPQRPRSGEREAGDGGPP